MQGETLPHFTLAENWMVFVLIAIFLAVGYVRLTYPRRFIRLIRSLINPNSLLQMMREELVFSHRGSLLLLLVFVLSGGLMTYLAVKAINLFDESPYGLHPILWSTGLLFLIYSVKWFVNAPILYLLARPDIFRTHMFLVATFNKAIGLVLVPFSILAAYLPSKYGMVFGIAGLIIWGILLLLRLVQEASFTRIFRLRWYYFIFYLCALEILPVLVGLKWVKFGH
jgi:hypothetical protein